jgi:hypothetical protein
MSRGRVASRIIVAVLACLLLAGVGVVWLLAPVLLPGQSLRLSVSNEPVRSIRPAYGDLAERDGSLEIDAHRYFAADSEEYVSLQLPNPRSNGQWVLGAGQAHASYARRRLSDEGAHQYVADSAHAGRATLRWYSPMLHVAAGAFEFDARRYHGSLLDTPPALK